MNAKQMGSSMLSILFIIAVAFTPISYVINPYLFVLMIYIGGFLLIGRTEGEGNKFLILLLYTTLFSGVSILGFRPYDIVILFGLLFHMLRKKEAKLPARIIPFILVVFAVLIINFYSESLMEAIRYIMCIIVFFEAMNDDYELDKINSEIITITLCNIFYAVIVFGLIYTRRFSNYTTPIINTNIYIYRIELRLNGFFSDPNKYMAFCFALLFLTEGFLPKTRKRAFTVLLICIASLMALSRTAMIVIFVFALLRIANIIKKRSKALFFTLIFIVCILVIIVAVAPSVVNDLFDSLYVLSSRLMGRERQLQLSSTIQGDNRIRIWGMAYELIKEKPIIGHGWMSNEWLLPYPTHNTVFAILLDGGIVALIAYVIMFWPMYVNRRWDIVVSCIIVPSLMLDLQNYRMWFLIYGLMVGSKLYLNNELE